MIRRTPMSLLVACVLLLTARAIPAATTPEGACLKGRYAAAAKYDACEQKVLASASIGVTDESKHSKCRIKYAATWAKLQAKASGSGATCDNPRWADNGNGTVTDRLTGLQWEQKTDDGSVHDKDDTYTWSTSGDGDDTDADGTAYTSFLSALNSGSCFAGQCDWRLPTRAELPTILLDEAYPCTTSPCIDQVAFGPTGIYYWSSTTRVYVPESAWFVNFGYGQISDINKDSLILHVRAVRGGL